MTDPHDRFRAMFRFEFDETQAHGVLRVTHATMRALLTAYERPESLIVCAGSLATDVNCEHTRMTGRTETA